MAKTNPSNNLDPKDSPEYIAAYLKESSKVALKIDQEVISRIVGALFTAWKENKNVFMMGNGGSATIAMHFMNDWGKGTFYEGKDRLQTICLVENTDLVTALVNDNGWENLYVDQIKGWLKKGDILIGFSVHGGSGSAKAGAWSQNMLKAYQYAKDQGAVTIGFSGYDGGAMRTLCDLCLVIPGYTTGHVQDAHVAVSHIIGNVLSQRIKSA